RLSAFGFGLPVALAAMVPVLNLFVVPAAVCGATAYWVRENGATRT
ncbi:MAG TPA: sulfate transporter CysZ, partial [Marinobacter adhaerens]|nr:sulfate transporter CysZ [Marinobacter adhaerens]